MGLSKKEIDGLIRLLGLTKDDEIDCDRFLSLIAEFAEQASAGKSIPKGLKAVEHHLSICAECHEEYESLRQALKDMDG